MPTETTPPLGPEFRRLRKARGLSLTDVAEATSISSSFLSLFENNKSDITFIRLVRLVEFFGISITDLIPDPEPTGTAIVHANARRQIVSRTEHAESFLLTHDTKHKMLPAIVVIHPDGGILEGVQMPGGEAFFLVLEGELEIGVPDEEPSVLREGDAAYYSLDRRPCPPLRNVTDRRAEVLIVTTPPSL
jgi:transcriptional regulator with XRE-family HTH domain